MDERIGILEDDCYFFYTDQEENTNMEETEDTEVPITHTTQIRQPTPPPKIFQETNNPFNYQRKRPALKIYMKDKTHSINKLTIWEQKR